jgi:hypothetical protein
MDYLKNFLKTHQQKIVLIIGYLLVAGLAFGMGRSAAPKYSKPAPSAVRAGQTSAVQNNYNPNQPAVQSASTTTKTNPAPASGSANCTGKIKGSSSLIYHVPGGSFYNKTTHPIRCFDTEAQAQAAGFRKSSR